MQRVHLASNSIHARLPSALLNAKKLCRRSISVQPARQDLRESSASAQGNKFRQLMSVPSISVYTSVCVFQVLLKYYLKNLRLPCPILLTMYPVICIMYDVLFYVYVEMVAARPPNQLQMCAIYEFRCKPDNQRTLAN